MAHKSPDKDLDAKGDHSQAATARQCRVNPMAGAVELRQKGGGGSSGGRPAGGLLVSSGVGGAEA